MMRKRERSAYADNLRVGAEMGMPSRDIRDQIWADPNDEPLITRREHFQYQVQTEVRSPGRVVPDSSSDTRAG